MTFKIVQTIKGQFSAATFSTEAELVEAALLLEHYVTGRTGTHARGVNQIELRQEIQDKPRFSGLLGPMYDGPGVCRYEDRQTYAELSQ